MFIEKGSLKKSEWFYPKGSVNPTRGVYLKPIVLLGVILALGLALRLYNLDRYSLWYDESVVVLDEWGLNQLLPLTKLFDSDSVIKNYDYLTLYSHGFVYYWQRLFGKSEFVLRSSSVIFSVLSIYFLYVIGKEIFNIKIAQLASFLVAISPLHIHYSQELRPYAAICLFTLISGYSVLRIIKTGRKIYWFIYTIFSVLNVYFLCMSLTVLFSFFVFFTFRIRRYRYLLRPFLITHMIIALLLIPVFLTLYPNFKFVLQNEIVPEFSEFPVWVGDTVSFRHLLFTLKNLSIGYNIDYYSFIGIFITAFYFILFLVGVFKHPKKIGTQMLIFCIFFPILFLFFISKIKTCYVDRYFFSISSFYILGVAAGLSKFKNKFFKVFIIALILFSTCFGLKNYYLNHLPEDHTQHVGVNDKKNIKPIAEIILENYQEGDRVAHTCRNTVFPLKLYIRGVCDNPDLIQAIDQGTVIFYMPGEEGLLAVDFAELHPVSVLPGEWKVVKDLEKINRLWLLLSSWCFRGIDSKEYKVVKTIKESFKVSRFEKFDGGFLYLFTKKVN